MKEKLKGLIREAVEVAFDLYDDPDHAADSAVIWVMTGIAKGIEEMEKKRMKQKKETSRGIYSEIYDLIVNLADEAEDKVEAACDKMMESDVDPKSVLGEELVETIKENRKRYKELSDLLARFEEEAMEKIVNEIKEAERNGWTYGCNDEKDA